MPRPGKEPHASGVKVEVGPGEIRITGTDEALEKLHDVIGKALKMPRCKNLLVIGFEGGHDISVDITGRRCDCDDI